MWLDKNGSRLFTELWIYPWPGLWRNLRVISLLQGLGGVLPAGAPLGAGIATFLPRSDCRHAQPSPARTGNICLCVSGPGVPPAASSLPPALFIAFRQHLEFEPVRRWLTPRRGMELCETCVAREGGHGGPPSPSQPRVGAAALQCGLRTIQGPVSPGSILALIFPVMGGEIAAMSSPHSRDLGVLCPCLAVWSCFLPGL